MPRHLPKRPHSHIPSDEDRNVAIAHAAKARLEPALLSHRVELSNHSATFRRELHSTLIVYTPNQATNFQSTDRVLHGAPALVGSR